MPVYNHARYVLDAVRSVLAEERYPLELILVDDGSTDNPLGALETVLNDSRLKIITQTNAGLSRALNRGFQEASGGFLTWTSADNEFLPGALTRLADFLRANPGVGFVYGNVRLIDDSGKSLPESDYRTVNQRAGDTSLLDLPKAAETLLALNDNFINSCFLFRREVFALTGAFDPDKNGYEDYDYWLRAATAFRFAHLDSEEPLYRYRLHSGSLTAKLGPNLNRLQERSVFQSAERRYRLETEAPEKLSKLADRLSPASFAHLNHARYAHPEAAGPIGSGEHVVLPPLRVPALLRRARDGSLGAVVRHETATGCALVFPPDAPAGGYAEERMHSLISGADGISWVLFCRTPVQRAFADRVNLALKNNANFRIIDVSTESNSDWEPPRPEHFSAKPWQERSLLYALSSVDAVFSLRRSLDEPNELLELRIEAALAALAGIPIFATVEDTPLSTLPPELRHLALDMPHLVLCEKSFDPARLAEGVPAAAAAIDIGTLEQWLEEQAEPRTAKKLKALRLTAEPSKS